MFSQSTSSNLSNAIITSRKLEKNFLNNELLSVDHDRNKIRLNFERHMETFVQLTRKRHDTWHRHDKYFREALKKEKDRDEKRKERHGLVTKVGHVTLPSLIALNSRPEPLTKVEQRTYQVLHDSQKLLDQSTARSRYNFNQSRPSTTTSTQTRSTVTRSSSTLNSISLPVPIDYEEYNRLMNESLKRETYSDFVDHFIKFRPEFREHFARSHQINKRQNAVEKLKEFNQTYAKTRDQRYHNLIRSLTDFRSE